MFRRACRSVCWAIFFGCVVSTLWAGRPAVAQDQPHPPIQLDLQRLIASAGNGAQSERFQDEVWSLQPEPGRRTVLLPIHVTPGSAAYELSRPAISIRSARFVGWYLPEARSNTNNNANDGTFRAGDSLDLEGLLLGEDAPGDRGRGELGGQVDALDDATDGSAHAPVRDDAPRLARKLIIYPDGSVGWEMDRAFNGAEARPAGSNNLYGYKLDPEALRNEEPPRLERLTRNEGESSRDYAARRREQQQSHRDAQDTFRELREEIRDLPDEFREAGTGVVFAVFDAPDRDEWSYTGDAPLPWEIQQQDLAAIAEMADGRGGGGGDGLDAQTAELARILAGVAQRGGVMDHRAIAIAVYEGRLAERVSNNDDGYKLLRILATSSDQEARAIALGSIARVQPPTRASAQLLADAARNASGEMASVLQLAAMRSAFRIEAGGDGNTGRLITQVNDALAAAQGPPAAKVLEEVIDAMGPAETDPNRGGTSSAGNVEALPTLLAQTDFDKIPADQMPGVIAMVIRRAPGSTLAAGWLDTQLLRSSDGERTDLTLELLAQADSDSQLIQPLTDEVRSLVFGADNVASGSPRQRVALEGVIPLDSEQHGLIAALTSNDAARRELAWAVLRHFELVGTDSSAQGEVRETFDRIVGIGMDVTSHPSTPPSLVDFIDNQSDSALADHARGRMLALVMTEGIAPAASRRAARKVVSTGHDYSQALNALSPAERGTLVAQVYLLLTGETPAVVGLIGDSGRNDLSQWLAGQWSAGLLPSERAWADAGGDQDQLLRLAGSNDPAVSAGAAAAMVIRAGGTTHQQTQLIQTIAASSDRSPAGIRIAWEPIRRDIFAEHLSDAAGPYRLTLEVYNRPSDAGQAGGVGIGEPASRPPTARDGRGGRSPSRLAQPATNPRGQGDPGGLGPATQPPHNAGQRTVLASYDLGIVQLRIDDGGNVALSVAAVPIALAPDRLALRIEDVSTLAGFQTPGLDDLPLSQLDESVDLVLIDADTWAGDITLPDGRSLEITLRRER